MPFSKGVRGAAPESTGFSRGGLAKGQIDKPERFIALPGYAARKRQGGAPDSPLGERKGTFDLEDAVRNVESAFALLLERVTEPRLAPEKGLIHEENDKCDGRKGIGEPQQKEIPCCEYRPGTKPFEQGIYQRGYSDSLP